MGFQQQDYKLVWPEGSRWHGLEVTVADMSIDELKTVSKIGKELAASEEELAESEIVLTALGKALLDWNYEDRAGVPIPISDFRKQGLQFLTAVVRAWLAAAGEVDAPLEANLSDGNQSVAGTIPMEIPSSSHLSSTTPN